MPNERMTSSSAGFDESEFYDVQNVLFAQYFAAGGFAMHLNYWQPGGVFGVTRRATAASACNCRTRSSCGCSVLDHARDHPRERWPHARPRTHAGRNARAVTLVDRDAVTEASPHEDPERHAGVDHAVIGAIGAAGRRQLK